MSASPSNFVDLTGRRFGRLTVIRRVKHPQKWIVQWLCQCSCGKRTKVFGNNLRRGHTQSCGCLQQETMAKHVRRHNKPRHGHCRNGTSTLTYRVWSSMLERCRNSSHHAYDRYGGRGITVCRRWYVFENFLGDMGKKPKGRSIDRIDNDGNYTPNNCRWATLSQQNTNRGFN